MSESPVDWVMPSNQPADSPQRANRPTLEAVREDYRLLDQVDVSVLNGGCLVWPTYPLEDPPRPEIDRMAPTRLAIALRWFPLAHAIMHALCLLLRTDRRSVILANGGAHLGKITCIANHLLPIRRRRILLFETFVETSSRLSRLLVRWMVLGSTVCIAYSRRQAKLQAESLGVPKDKFIFVPYKANHSKQPPLSVPIGNYVFSGGNSARDYRTLFEAVRDTGIPVIVSTTNPEVTRSLRVPANVIVLAAREPAFARLTAGSRFTVMPVLQGLIRGGGETNICNAMWHGKPVVAADDLAASEYIQEGVTGYVVPAGDVQALRDRIVALWNDPERVAEMGRKAHEHVASNFTHEQFLRRLRQLAILVASK